MAATSADSKKALRVIWGIILLLICVFIVLSLAKYDWRDIDSLKVPPNDPPVNLIGPVGAWLVYTMFIFIGLGAYLVPIWCLIFSALLLFDDEERLWPKLIWCLVLVLSISSLLELSGKWWQGITDSKNIPFTGGFPAEVVTSMLYNLFAGLGTGFILASLFLVSLVMFIGPRNTLKGLKAFWSFLCVVVDRAMKREEKKEDRRFARIDEEQKRVAERKKRLEKEVEKRPEPEVEEKEEKPVKKVRPEPEEKPEPPKEEIKEEEKEEKEESLSSKLINKIAGEKKPKEKKIEELPVEPPPPPPPPKRKPLNPNYTLPPISLLSQPEGPREITTNSETASMVISETLKDFGIEVEVKSHEVGPVVTRYELLPAPGIKIERIAALSNNIALALKAASIRIQAPIPGKGLVGIEVPNAITNKVFVREILDGDIWKNCRANVPLILGKDVGGKDMIADLATMPHVLIAGATGSGKTVCMNSILSGMLMSKTPDELKLILVDPKIVEFTQYNTLPHLIAPVITNSKKVVLGLRWAISEMEKRYKLFAKVGVRNIESYNNREVSTQPELFPEGTEPPQPKPDEPPQTIPYIVIVIDELADIMLTDGPDVENAIARLAQLSRAVGIHMIIATQRPSVNVITGTIKANLPCRIAFQVAQKTDSRTILDQQGAEKLLGRGDMLFLPPGASKLVRAQGALILDDDIKKIVTFINKQAVPDYELAITEQIERASNVTGSMDDGADEDLLDQSIEIIRETRRASTSSLQRRLRIGYTRAARIMDILEERGIIGPPKGSEAREILIDLDGEIPNNTVNQQEEQ